MGASWGLVGCRPDDDGRWPRGPGDDPRVPPSMTTGGQGRTPRAFALWLARTFESRTTDGPDRHDGVIRDHSPDIRSPGQRGRILHLLFERPTVARPGTYETPIQ